MRLLDVCVAILVTILVAMLAYMAVHEQAVPITKYTETKFEETEVVIEQACVNGYEWVVLVNADGQGVALEQAFKASEVPGACPQPVKCEDL